MTAANRKATHDEVRGLLPSWSALQPLSAPENAFVGSFFGRVVYSAAAQEHPGLHFARARTRFGVPFVPWGDGPNPG